MSLDRSLVAQSTLIGGMAPVIARRRFDLARRVVTHQAGLVPFRWMRNGRREAYEGGSRSGPSLGSVASVAATPRVLLGQLVTVAAGELRALLSPGVTT